MRQNCIGFHINYLPAQKKLQCFPSSLGKIIFSNGLFQSNHTTVQVPCQFHLLVFTLKMFLNTLTFSPCRRLIL